MHIRNRILQVGRSNNAGLMLTRYVQILAIACAIAVSPGHIYVRVPQTYQLILRKRLTICHSLS